MPKTIINVNRYNIKRNEDRRNYMPVVTIWDGKTEDHCHEVIIYGQDGLEAARVMYNRDNPARPSSKVWIETDNEIEKIVK